MCRKISFFFSPFSASNPFNKAELSSILKFGAEELFKGEEDDEGELQVNFLVLMIEFVIVFEGGISCCSFSLFRLILMIY